MADEITTPGHDKNTSDTYTSPPQLPIDKSYLAPTAMGRGNGGGRRNVILTSTVFLLIVVVIASLLVALIPEKDGLQTSWIADRAAASSENDLNQAGAKSAPQQDVVNGWYTNDLLDLQSQQLDEVIKGLSQISQRSKRTNVLIAILIFAFAAQSIALLYLVSRWRMGHAGGEASLERENDINVRTYMGKEKVLTSCPNCKTQIGEGFKICPNCGRILELKCTDCGRDLKPEWKNCPQCGKELRA